MFKLFILLFTFTTLLFSANPKPYATLGNKIYDNANNIKKLTTIGDYYLYVDKINNYFVKVNLAKQLGFSLDKNSTPKEKREYLQTLRKLSKDNDYYIRMVHNSFETSMQNGDSLLFNRIINSGLIDTKANKKRILDYYFAHSKDINSSGVIQSYLDEDEALRRKHEAMKRKRLSKKMLEEQKIKRLRERDKARQIGLEKKLNEALEKKKREIREEQREELIKSL